MGRKEVVGGVVNVMGREWMSREGLGNGVGVVKSKGMGYGKGEEEV